MSNRANPLSPLTIEASRLLGARVRLARRERRWTLQELADRAGVTAVTMRKVERGDPSVGLGIAFEAAALTGVPLFDPDRRRRQLESRPRRRSARGPAAAGPQAAEIDDDF